MFFAILLPRDGEAESLHGSRTCGLAYSNYIFVALSTDRYVTIVDGVVRQRFSSSVTSTATGP